MAGMAPSRRKARAGLLPLVVRGLAVRLWKSKNLSSLIVSSAAFPAYPPAKPWLLMLTFQTKNTDGAPAPL